MVYSMSGSVRGQKLSTKERSIQDYDVKTHWEKRRLRYMLMKFLSVLGFGHVLPNPFQELTYVFQIEDVD